MGGKSWQLFLENGYRYLETFCGRLISEKFYVPITPWDSLPVNPKPEVVEIMVLEGRVMTHIKGNDSLITMMSHMTYYDSTWRHKWRFLKKNFFLILLRITTNIAAHDSRITQKCHMNCYDVINDDFPKKKILTFFLFLLDYFDIILSQSR